MDFIDDIARTQYGDYRGKIQIDTHSGADLFSLCNDNGIDTENHFPIAFGTGEHTINGIGQEDEISIDIYTVEKKDGGRTFDEIAAYIQRQDGKVEVIKHRVEIPYRQLYNYIKRYELFVINKEMGRLINDFVVKDKTD